MVIDYKNFVDSLADFNFVIIAIHRHNFVSGGADPFESQFKPTVGIRLANWAAHDAAWDILTQILLVQHLHDLATCQFFEANLVLLPSSNNHSLFYLSIRIHQ